MQTFALESGRRANLSIDYIKMIPGVSILYVLYIYIYIYIYIYMNTIDYISNIYIYIYINI